MLVIAFDGILFDTLELRATAVVEALAAEAVVVQMPIVQSLIASRSLAEAVRASAYSLRAVHEQSAPPSRATDVQDPFASSNVFDETALDLATLRAERAMSQFGSRGALLDVVVRDKLRRAAAVSRIVVRADSPRRDVDELLALAELDSVTSFILCSDDVVGHAHRRASAQGAHIAAGAHSARWPEQSTVERSYEHIARRLYSNTTFLGTSAGIGIALEPGETARIAARQHGFDTPRSFDATGFSGS